MTTANLPSAEQVAHAQLPQAYEAAKQALLECSRIDQCKDWADKAIALASYARQSDDDTLMNHARRIQARAVRRCGELMEEFDARGDHRRIPLGVDSSPSKREVAAGAGLSKKQQERAVQVANVPQSEFDAAVDGESPPTVTELANKGKTPRDVVGDTPPESFSAATGLIGAVGRLNEFCQSHSPEHVSKGIKPFEAERVRQQMSEVREWWDAFSQHQRGVAA